jgi:cytochrome c oxidase assembly protein subunit 15
MILLKQHTYLVKYWLSSLLITIILIVLIGGLTRLTDSGLSITEWEIFSGILPPLNSEDWNEAFNLYKKIPQYYLINLNITLEEFKIIYYWEYFHRLLGRFIGLLFLIPFCFFLLKKTFNKEYNLKFSSLFFLILLQGFMGWYMVKSGLTENTTVSHFRLAIHLNLALILFSSIFWYFLNIVSEKNKPFFNFSIKNNYFKFFVLLIFLQITLGAFVSGLDAGQVYQTWPLMNNNFFPDDLNFKNLTFEILFNEASFVQFLHRNLAYFIFFYSILILIYIFYKKKENLYFPYLLVFLFLSVQIFMGITALTSGLNIVYASLHQVSTIFLLSSSIYLCHKSIN